MKQKFLPGTGPSQAKRAASKFEFTCIGRSGNKTVTTTLSGGYPGYDETAKMFSQAAFVLLSKAQNGTLRHGVCTPAEALGQALVSRLESEGMTIKQEVKQ